MERLIVLRIRRDIGLRAGLLVTLRFELSPSRCLAARISTRLEFLRHLLQDLDVRRDAFGLNRAAGRSEVPRRGQPQSPIAETKRNDGLHRPLSERACTDDRRAPVILQSTSPDLGGESRAAVDQHDNGLALGEIARACIEPLGFLCTAAANGYDLSLLEERVRDRDRLIEQPAGIVA